MSHRSRVRAPQGVFFSRRSFHVTCLQSMPIAFANHYTRRACRYMWKDAVTFEEIHMCNKSPLFLPRKHRSSWNTLIWKSTCGSQGVRCWSSVIRVVWRMCKKMTYSCWVSIGFTSSKCLPRFLRAFKKRLGWNQPLAVAAFVFFAPGGHVSKMVISPESFAAETFYGSIYIYRERERDNFIA